MSDMIVKPLKKELYNKLKELGVKRFTLAFEGGSDEGYLEVEVYPYDLQGKMDSEIEDWAWSAYEYNGAGDGNSYGDKITYDLEEGKTSTETWYMVREDDYGDENTLEVEDGSDEEKE
jgi:hypothetical protein